MPLSVGASARFLFVQNHAGIAAVTFHNVSHQEWLDFLVESMTDGIIVSVLENYYSSVAATK